MNDIVRRTAEASAVDVKGFSSCCSLKRKRPPTIQIPKVLREISTDIFKRCAQEQSDGSGAKSFADSGVGVFTLKGKKKFMEDSYKIASSSSSGSKRFFGVYDGHGGSKAAEFVAENLHLNIFKMLEASSADKPKEEAVRTAYLETDEKFLRQGLGSGSCCVTALIEGDEMLVSNLGDCRAVLCRDGIAEALTNDHRAAQAHERRRIEAKGGYVEFHRGAWRVHGTLAVSRSIGDSHLKDWVIAEPETKIVRLTSDMQYLILASDGLWEEVDNQEAVDIVMRSCSTSRKNQLVRSSFSSPIVSPGSKTKRIYNHHQQQQQQNTSEEDDDEQCNKSRRISLTKQKKIKITHFTNDENKNGHALVEKKPSHDSSSGLVAACMDLVHLAVDRGSLDDITVVIIDLNNSLNDSKPTMNLQ